MSPAEFKPLGIEDKAIYNTYYIRSGNRVSDVNFASRIAWNPAFCYQWTVIEDTLVMLSPSSCFSTIHFSVPLGLKDAAQLTRILDILWDQFAGIFAEQTGRPPHLRFLHLEKSDINTFNFLKNYRAEVVMKPAFSDYIYEGQDLRTLQGRFYNGKRNHVNKFMRTYPDAVFRPLEKADEAACLELMKGWDAEKGADPNNLRESDYLAIQNLFRYFDDLGLSGGSLWAGNSLVAFSMVSRGAADTVIVHVEKADVEYRGAYAVINKMTAEAVFSDARWINREEDMGIEGLHQAKMSYGPAHMVDKYEVHITRKDG